MGSESAADAVSEDSVQAFFKQDPKRIALFRSVERIVQSLGRACAEITRSQVSFGTPIRFAWVWLPLEGSRRRPEHCLVLSIGLGRAVEDLRIVESVQPYPGRWTHHIIIADEADLDGTVADWLREAREFALERGRQRKKRTGG